jgi:cytosine/adenosine deaminase-related metal-dependent hydrolase
MSAGGGANLVIEGCAIATMDPARTEHSSGHIVVSDGRVAAVGAGPAPAAAGFERLDAAGLLATPGLVNCHHHLYQWLTRGMAQQANLFEWLTTLYPVWAHIDAEMVQVAATAGLLRLATSGCTTSTDHHYVFPRRAGDLLEASIEAARPAGLRFHPCRGSMDLGRSAGGLPPDEIVEDTDEALAQTERAIDRWHDPSFGSKLRIAVAPCSPFSATGELMRAAAELARRKGVRLHTHLAETEEENDFCKERFGIRPVEYVDDLGWTGPDVWLAHCVHLEPEEVGTLGATSTGVAHCPSSNGRLGAGIAPVASLLRAGAPVGLGVDGAASNEPGELQPEMRGALLAARLRGGPRALAARDCLSLATINGARCLGRAHETGSLEVGKAADIALWKRDDLGSAGISDPVAALVFGSPARVHRVLVGGVTIVSDGVHLALDEAIVAEDLAKSCRRLAERAGIA